MPSTVPLQFATTLTGTTLKLTITSAPASGASVANFDADIGYSTGIASYVSSSGGSGYAYAGNQSTPGTVKIAGFDSSGGDGMPAGSVLAVLTFTLSKTVTDFPLTLNNVVLNSDPAASGMADPSVACFVRGTMIRTEGGEVAVERLQAGDRVVLADGSSLAVTWVGSRRVACGLHPAPHDVMPVRLHAGCVAKGVPARDLVLSPDHAILLEGALIPVRYLLNGATIVQEEWSEVRYFHVELERHAVLLAEGMPAESYLDTGNRGRYGDGVTTLLALPSHALSVWREQGCAPLVTDGPVLARAQTRLAKRARQLGHETTVESGIHLNADGVIVEGKRDGDVVSFTVPTGARSVRLASRQFVPGHMFRDNIDMRRLGVGVAELSIDGRRHEPAVGDGWLPAESGLRWTDGNAALPGARRRVKVRLVELGLYWAHGPLPVATQAGTKAA